MSISDIIKGLMSGGNSGNASGIPIPQPNPQRLPSLTPTPAAQPSPTFGDRVGDAMSGIAMVQPGANALTSFAQGFSGNRAARKQRADETQAKADKAAASQAAASQQAFENQLKRDEAKRKATADRFNNLQTAANIQKIQTEANRYGISPKAFGDIEERMNAYREVLAGKYGTALVNGDDADTLRTSIEELVAIERDRQIEQARSAAGESDPMSTKALGPKGTETNPHEPMSPADLERLPSGVIYRNPADGRLFQKK